MCGADATLRVGDEVFSYLGYDRANKSFSYKDGSGAVHIVQLDSPRKTDRAAQDFVFKVWEQDKEG